MGLAFEIKSLLQRLPLKDTKRETVPDLPQGGFKYVNSGLDTTECHTGINFYPRNFSTRSILLRLLYVDFSHVGSNFRVRTRTHRSPDPEKDDDRKVDVGRDVDRVCLGTPRVKNGPINKIDISRQ